MFKAYQSWGKVGGVSDVLKQLADEKGTVVKGIFRINGKNQEGKKGTLREFTLPSSFEDDTYWEFQKNGKTFFNRFKLFNRNERRKRQEQNADTASSSTNC